MRVARTVMFLGFAATAFAAEATSAEKPAPPPEDSIAAAKRDLEAIKASRGVTEQPRADLPQFAAPDLQIGLPATRRPNAPLSPAEAAAAKKSANWLVDAMMKKAERTADGNTEKIADADGAENADGLTATERRPASGKPERHDSRALTEPVVNPLTNFMAGWMTPGDYKLLQPGLGTESAANLVARGEPSSGQSVGSGGEGSSLAAFGKTAPARSSSPPRENPFLQDLLPSYQSAATAAAPPPPVSTANASSPKAFTPSPEPPPQKPVTPAFAKPNDDAKYFKPLKRF